MIPYSAIAACPGDQPWYALKVRARSEPVAVAVLRNRGYDPFAPTISERRRYCDRMTVIQTPVFPGYVFCRLNPNRKVPVLSTPAVEYIVSFDGVPAIVPEEEIEAVRRAIEAGAVPRSYLAVGQRIRIEYGSLAGLEGILERTGKENRLVVSVHLLQRSVSVEIDDDQVQAIQPILKQSACPSPTHASSR
jgi:transcription antitermination factor NusG